MNCNDNFEEEYFFIRSQLINEPTNTTRTRTKLKRLDIENLSDEECKKLFRFTYNEINRICTALELNYTLNFGIKVEGCFALAMLLYRYSFPRRLHDMKLVFGIAEENISRIINGFADLIMDKIKYGVVFDERQFSLENCERFSEAIFLTGAFYDNVVGFIDGTMQQICRPSDQEEQKIMYNGWKHMHCEKFQAITTPDGITSSLCGPYVGRRNDRGMLNMSDILTRIDVH